MVVTPASAQVRHLSDFSVPVRTASRALPDPEPFLRNITIGTLEVFAGVRQPEQLARWLTEEPYRALVTRTNLATRARNARGVAATRPKHRILSIRYSSPSDGVVEGVIIVESTARTRALAIRIEGLDGRWRATSLALL